MGSCSQDWGELTLEAFPHTIAAGETATTQRQVFAKQNEHTVGPVSQLPDPRSASSTKHTDCGSQNPAKQNAGPTRAPACSLVCCVHARSSTVFARGPRD